MKRRPWTEEEIETLRCLYPDTPTKKIASQFGRPLTLVYQKAIKIGLRKTPEYLASPAACRLRREASAASIATRFKSGQVPFNKGLQRPGWAPGRMADTQFRKGSRSGRAAALWQSVGSTRLTKEGYLQRKVTDTGDTVADYVEVHRLLWEESYGPIPDGHAVVFRDKDRTNIVIDNLELITRRELMLRNSAQRWGKEVFGVIQLRGALNRKLRKLNEKQDIGSSQPSV